MVFFFFNRDFWFLTFEIRIITQKDPGPPKTGRCVSSSKFAATPSVCQIIWPRLQRDRAAYRVGPNRNAWWKIIFRLTVVRLWTMGSYGPYLSISIPNGLLGRRERGERPLLRSVLMS